MRILGMIFIIVRFILKIRKMATATRPVSEKVERVLAIVNAPNMQAYQEQLALVKEPEVIQWLYGDLSFLPEIEHKNKTKDEEKYKVLEVEWGQNLMIKHRPDLDKKKKGKKNKQWTTKMGEQLTEELLILLGKTPTKRRRINGLEPDVEVDDAMWEAKAQTFYTPGTAGEKILGVPFKYADVPELYGSKPLKILCMGRAEQLCREQYGNLIGDKTTEKKRRFIEFYKQNGIEWVGATELIEQIIAANT
jgi:hypothetical protein